MVARHDQVFVSQDRGELGPGSGGRDHGETLSDARGNGHEKSMTDDPSNPRGKIGRVNTHMERWRIFLHTRERNLVQPSGGQMAEVFAMHHVHPIRQQPRTK